jgi:3-oxoacyl-[acyl-carrier protein] reductase
MGEHMLSGRGRDAVLADSGLGELTTPDDVAAVVTLLATGRARHASGSTIDVNAASYVH